MPKLLLASLLLAGIVAAEDVPLTKLPAHVKASAGKLTLFADYKAVEGEQVTLYLVNRTGKKLAFDSQDGELYIKLLAKEKGGTWARAQGHRFSWCGNSYFVRPELPDGRFLILRGYFPKKGEKREVRYRFFGQDLVSNVGQGLVDLAEIEKCRGDSFAARFGDFGTVAAIAEGKVKTTKRDHINVRPFAVGHLARFKHPPCIMLLERLLRDKDAQVRVNAVRVLGSFGDLAKSARPAMQKLAKEDPEASVRDAAQRALARK